MMPLKLNRGSLILRVFGVLATDLTLLEGKKELK